MSQHNIAEAFIILIKLLIIQQVIIFPLQLQPKFLLQLRADFHRHRNKRNTRCRLGQAAEIGVTWLIH